MTNFVWSALSVNLKVILEVRMFIQATYGGLACKIGVKLNYIKRGALFSAMILTNVISCLYWEQFKYVHNRWTALR